jgi:hypothetical protein
MAGLGLRGMGDIGGGAVGPHLDADRPMHPAAAAAAAAAGDPAAAYRYGYVSYGYAGPGGTGLFGPGGPYMPMAMAPPEFYGGGPGGPVRSRARAAVRDDPESREPSNHSRTFEWTRGGRFGAYGGADGAGAARGARDDPCHERVTS